MWKCLISRFMEDVNNQRQILFLFLSLNLVPWNSASEGFAYNWQSKWVGIIAIKTERSQIHFLRDVVVAVASLDLKVTIREFTQRRRRPQRERLKSNRFTQGKQQLWTCITLFCTFICRRYTTATWNWLFSRFLEDGNKRQQFSFSFPELWRSPLEFNSKKFAYIWRIKRDGISAIKFEAAQIHFLRGRSLVKSISFRWSPPFLLDV